MWLPSPTPDQVKEFAELAQKEFDLDLTPDEALDAATRLLRIHFILAYAYRPDGEPMPSIPKALRKRAK